MRVLLCCLFLVLSSSINAQVNSDSLWTVWSDESAPVMTRLEALKSIDYTKDYNLRFGNHIDTAFYHLQLGYDLAELHGLKEWMGETLINQGNLFNKKSEPAKAKEWFLRSRAIGEEIGDQNLIGKCSYNIGLGYMFKGDFANGFPEFSRANDLFKENGNEKLQAHSLEKMAFLCSQQNDLVTSNTYLRQSLSIREELIKTNENPRDLFVIAGMKQTIKVHEAEINMANDNLDEKTGLEQIQAVKEEMLSLSAQLDSAETKEAEEHPEQPRKPNLHYQSLVPLIDQGEVLIEQEDTQGGIKHLEDALSMALKKEELNSTAYITGTLYEAYKSDGQYQKSLGMLEDLLVLKDSAVNMKNATAVVQNRVKSEYEKQKAVDDIENAKQLAIETQKKKNQQLLSIIVGAGLLLISILAFVIFNRLKLSRKQEAIIAEQKKRAEQSEKYKEQFLANMSHEIRTPMHAISGMVNILARNQHPETQDVYLKAMRSSSDNLVVILNDVLDLSKIEAGKLDIERIPMSPAAVIENVIQVLKYKAEEKGLVLRHHISEDVPAIVMGDSTRLNQILTNLVGNAIKFTEKGTIDLTLSDENNHLRFTIKDTGIGIRKEKLQTIFNAFEQAQIHKTTDLSGTGLGLSISKQLVELQEGKIWVESEEGKGSTFYVELSIIEAQNDAIGTDLISKDQLHKMATSLKGISILIAEDNEFNQMIAKDDLDFYIEGVTVEVVANGALAVEKFKTGNYDLILMDVQMPEMNGFETTLKIRDIEANEDREKRIPIIAMTASLLKSEIENCYTAKMDNYIPKPYKAEELIGTIHEMVSPSKAN